MEDIKNIEIINKNIKKLKSSIRAERLTICMSLVNGGIVGDTLCNYGSELELYSKFVCMAVMGVCFTLFCTSAEKIKINKFKIDELKFEKEKLELDGKSR